MTRKTDRTSGAPSPSRTLEGTESQRPLRVLVVDDDKVDRLALKRTLEQADCPVSVGEADGVVAAIHMLATESFDCVLLDYNLPDGDGLTFLRGIRGAGIAAAVIMITGQQDAQVASELMQAGAADYIPKALLTPNRVLRSIERLCGRA